MPLIGMCAKAATSASCTVSCGCSSQRCIVPSRAPAATAASRRLSCAAAMRRHRASGRCSYSGCWHPQVRGGAGWPSVKVLPSCVIHTSTYSGCWHLPEHGDFVTHPHIHLQRLLASARARCFCDLHIHVQRLLASAGARFFFVTVFRAQP